MVDTEAIQKAMVAKGLTSRKLADEIGVSYHTVINRMRHGNWTVLEAWKVSQVLEIGLDVFFAYPERISA